MGGGGMGGAGGGGGGSAGSCPAETICLAVKPTESGNVEPGRIIVWWSQLNDDGPDPVPFIGYDQAFDPKVAQVEIPISAIKLPSEELLLCERACDDEAMCPCVKDPKVGTGLIMVVRDTDMSGDISLEEIGNDLYGVGYMVVGYSEQEYVPAPMPLDMLFTDGIDKGVRPYRIIEKGAIDALGRTKAGDVLDLNVCDAPSAACAPPFPNIT
jgi:hypothetical protein